MKITKKLRDVTENEFRKWKAINCFGRDVCCCSECQFYNVRCGIEVNTSWVNNKDFYSDKFLDQEIEFEVPDILDKEEKEYLSAVIKPFRDRVISISKDYNGIKHLQYIKIDLDDGDAVCLPYFKVQTMYKNMEPHKQYTLEELGL